MTIWTFSVFVEKFFAAALKALLNIHVRTHLADDEDVGEPGGKAVACAILDVHHIKGARVTLPVGDHANTPQVSTTSHHAHVTWKEEGSKHLQYKKVIIF